MSLAKGAKEAKEAKAEFECPTASKVFPLSFVFFASFARINSPPLKSHALISQPACYN